jgi:hypothetical protein
VLALFAAPDLEALAKLTDAEFFTAFLRGVMEKQPDLKETLAGANYRFLGYVTEGSSAHVVYRMSMRVGHRDLVMPSVISVTPNGRDWAALLTGEIDGLAQLLMLRYSGAKAEDALKAGPTEPRVLGQLKEGKAAVHVVVRWSSARGPVRISKVAAHTVRPGEPAWKLRNNPVMLAKHLRKNYAP